MPERGPDVTKLVLTTLEEVHVHWIQVIDNKCKAAKNIIS